MIKEILKIEFRAVPFGSTGSHVLEFRISPNQDLRYYKEHHWFWGLIKFGTVAKYSTKWVQPTIFRNTPSSYKNIEEDSYNYLHIFIRKKQDLEQFKNNYKTYGEFLKWYNEEDQKERIAYRKSRAEYENEMGVWD